MEDLISGIFSVLIPGVILILIKNRLNLRRARLIYYISSVSDFILAPQEVGQKPLPIFTHLITIKNNGNKAVENVDICHFFLPKDFRVTPSLEYEIVNEKIIRFKSLGPKESVTISYVYFTMLLPHQIHEYVRSKDGYAKYVSMILNPVFPKWFNILAIVLMCLGLVLIGFFIWWITSLVIHAIKSA